MDGWTSKSDAKKGRAKGVGTCVSRKADGKPCGSKKIPGSVYCGRHSKLCKRCGRRKSNKALTSTGKCFPCNGRSS